MKKLSGVLAFFAVFVLLFTFGITASAAEFTGEVDAKSVILMEAETGRVLYEKNADEALPPASVTKVMTLLLVMEAVDSGTLSLDDTVVASEAATSKGGSQVYLKVGEEMSVSEMIKCVAVASANDCAAALAEHISGSEDAFVERMNRRAGELGMENTHFDNCTGLDDSVTNHVTSARDIALMSRELMKHPKIFDYTTLWMDSIRDGAFGLTNTNRLVRFYKGATGLKTGSTSKAGFCISATAMRDGMHLIAVIMGSPTRDTRNEIAKRLLDFGFANYGVTTFGGNAIAPVRITGAYEKELKASYGEFSVMLEKENLKNVTQSIEVPEEVTAPIKKGDKIGVVRYTLDGALLGEVPITADEDIGRVGFLTLFGQILRSFFLCK